MVQPPKAYLPVLLFDERFTFDEVDSFVQQVQSTPGTGTIDKFFANAVQVRKNGYACVYASNESDELVYFDNLLLTHERGPILEENHYHPFGMMMAGISSKALNSTPNNKYKFNGGNEQQSGEFSDGSGLELFDAVNRSYDPQLGRFWQVDELAEANWEESVYSFAHNNPIQFNDPLGLTPDEPAENGGTPKVLETIVVKGKRKLTHNQMQSLYWQLRDNGIDISRVKSQALRERLYRWDRTQNFLDRYHAKIREQDVFVLEVGSWFVPMGWLTKIRYTQYAFNLFKWKRGISVGRVFWSGGRDVAGAAAMDFAKAEGMLTLEMTLKGKMLEKLTDLTSYKLTKPLWDKASRSFSKGAEGTVHVFQNATDGVSLTSTWRRIEYNILKEKNEIIFHDVFR